MPRNRARGLLTRTRQQRPIDVQAIIDLASIPSLVERNLSEDTRATIGHVAGGRAIILNRRLRFSSGNERRWVLAEELGHIKLGHKLAEGTAPGKLAIGLLEPRRHVYEREARAFAAKLLMPFGEVRRRWFGLSPDGISVEKMVQRIAQEFRVTTSTMRLRLREMKLVSA